MMTMAEEKEDEIPIERAIELLQVLRYLSDTGTFKPTAAKVVGAARHLKTSIQREKDVKKIAQAYPNWFRIEKEKGSVIRYYTLTQQGIIAMYNMTKNVIHFEPIELLKVRGNPRTGYIMSLKGIYRDPAGNEDTLAYLFQFDVLLLNEKMKKILSVKEESVAKIVGHIRCLWKQCRARGEEVNFSNKESLNQALSQPHIRYFIKYLITNIDDILSRPENNVLSDLIIAILEKAEDIFGKDNVEIIKLMTTSIAAFSEKPIRVYRINVDGEDYFVCRRDLSSTCGHVRLAKKVVKDRTTSKDTKAVEELTKGTLA